MLIEKKKVNGWIVRLVKDTHAGVFEVLIGTTLWWRSENLKDCTDRFFKVDEFSIDWMK